MCPLLFCGAPARVFDDRSEGRVSRSTLRVFPLIPRRTPGPAPSHNPSNEAYNLAHQDDGGAVHRSEIISLMSVQGRRCSTRREYSITSSVRMSRVGGTSKAERPCRDQIHNKIELGRLLDRNFARLCPAQNLVQGSPPMNWSGLACRLSRRLQPNP
jgi:hypothetical protein